MNITCQLYQHVDFKALFHKKALFSTADAGQALPKIPEAGAAGGLHGGRRDRGLQAGRGACRAAGGDRGGRGPQLGRSGAGRRHRLKSGAQSRERTALGGDEDGGGGAQSRDRTGTNRVRGILSPLCLPISPSGRKARSGVEPD